MTFGMKKSDFAEITNTTTTIPDTSEIKTPQYPE